MDTILDPIETAADYAADLTVQLKKGILTQCVLLLAEKPMYTSEILSELERAQLDIVEGTVYPLLTRLSREGLLTHQWQESLHGPPRKYYQITPYGQEVRIHLDTSIAKLNKVIRQLKRSKNE